MGHRYSGGQCAVEITLILGLITAVLVGISYLSFRSAPVLRDSQLSREIR
jgi:hypothetical protein